MWSLVGVPVLFVFFFLAAPIAAQIDDICADAGITPSIEEPLTRVPYVYGRVVVKGSGSKPRHLAVTLSDTQRSLTRQTLGASGNYCFRRSKGSGGTIIVEMNGQEVARRTLPPFGASQQREDFEIEANRSAPESAPGMVSARFARPPNEKTIDVYKKVAKAEKANDLEKSITYLKQIVAVDPEDYPAWLKLGAKYFERHSLPEAETALKQAIQLRADYTPAWIGMGLLQVSQKQFDAAIQSYIHASVLEPSVPIIFRLLGEAYFEARKGALALQALDKAIELDPIGMAVCHLEKARLYEVVGAKQLAANEYKIFLKKVPEYPEKKKLEKFIEENPN